MFVSVGTAAVGKTYLSCVSHHFQGTISETTGLILHIFNLASLLIFPSTTVLTVPSMTPGAHFFFWFSRFKSLRF